MEEQLLYPLVYMKSNLFNQSSYEIHVVLEDFNFRISIFGSLQWLDDAEIVRKTSKHHIT